MAMQKSLTNPSTKVHNFFHKLTISHSFHLAIPFVSSLLEIYWEFVREGYHQKRCIHFHRWQITFSETGNLIHGPSAYKMLADSYWCLMAPKILKKAKIHLWYNIFLFFRLILSKNSINNSQPIIENKMCNLCFSKYLPVFCLLWFPIFYFH